MSKFDKPISWAINKHDQRVIENVKQNGANFTKGKLFNLNFRLCHSDPSVWKPPFAENDVPQQYTHLERVTRESLEKKQSTPCTRTLQVNTRFECKLVVVRVAIPRHSRTQNVALSTEEPTRETRLLSTQTQWTEQGSCRSKQALWTETASFPPPTAAPGTGQKYLLSLGGSLIDT